MKSMEPFIANDQETLDAMQRDPALSALRRETYPYLAKYKYTYNFTWLGRPIIQLPEDIMMMQEIIMTYQPDLIVETGIAHGGSLVFSASMLQLLGKGHVVGVDIDIRTHNRLAIEEHPLAHRISMIEGSSTAGSVVEQVRTHVADAERVVVFLDSNHTHDHVLTELELYSPFVRSGGYIVVFDTGIEDMPASMYPDRDWGPGNNPKTAVREFLKTNNRFTIDRNIESRLLYSVAPDGYLKCIKD
jgi:cephalosporin hydroxylase